ncbi:hypothetical protein INT48_009338 [Thamnidium elegans]|uniref:Uncharacterized protein n=1 Tax=Thamnidium elegans TaxID=101142 RepID=A0A8H7SQ86_9FUNG|nr:hypothetical protein INT48_009338 [Thamnidium elegans]
MQIKSLSSQSINSRLGPRQAEIVEVDSDNETIISFGEEDSNEEAIEEITEEHQQDSFEKAEDFNFLNLLEIEPEKPYDEMSKEKMNNYNVMVLTEGVQADIWEYDSRMKSNAEHKARNEELMQRMAQNIVKLCHMQLPMPQTKGEYGRYLHLRGFYISSFTKAAKNSGRAFALKNKIKRIDDYECYEWFVGVPEV